MIDLHFLSISSSDSDGFSCTGAGGASGLTGRNKKKSIWKRKIRTVCKDDILKTEVRAVPAGCPAAVHSKLCCDNWNKDDLQAGMRWLK